MKTALRLPINQTNVTVKFPSTASLATLHSSLVIVVTALPFHSHQTVFMSLHNPNGDCQKAALLAITGDQGGIHAVSAPSVLRIAG